MLFKTLLLFYKIASMLNSRIRSTFRQFDKPRGPSHFPFVTCKTAGHLPQLPVKSSTERPLHKSSANSVILYANRTLVNNTPFIYKDPINKSLLLDQIFVGKHLVENITQDGFNITLIQLPFAGTYKFTFGTFKSENNKILNRMKITRNFLPIYDQSKVCTGSGNIVSADHVWDKFERGDVCELYVNKFVADNNQNEDFLITDYVNSSTDFPSLTITHLG